MPLRRCRSITRALHTYLHAHSTGAAPNDLSEFFYTSHNQAPSPQYTQSVSKYTHYYTCKPPQPRDQSARLSQCYAASSCHTLYV